MTKFNNLHWPVQLPLLCFSGHLLAWKKQNCLNCRLQIVTSLITGGALEFSFSLLVVEMTCEHSVWGERHTNILLGFTVVVLSLLEVGTDGACSVSTVGKVFIVGPVGTAGID